MQSSGAPRRRVWTLVVALCAVLLVTAGVIVGVMSYLNGWFQQAPAADTRLSLSDYDRILPGITICGVEVSGLTQEEAKAKVSNALQAAANETVFTVRFPDDQLEIRNYLECAVPTLESVVREAYQYGRDGMSTLEEAKARTSAAPLALSPATRETVKTDTIRSAVVSYANTLDDRPTDATISLHEGSIELIKGKDGRSLDMDDLCERIESACESGKQSIEASFTLSYSGERQLKALHEEFCTEAKDACWDAETQSVAPEERGQRFDLDAALTALQVPDGARVVIPVEYTQPSLTQAQLEEVLFVDELGSYSSIHTPIAPRTNNLILACEAINGTVLNPGDVFSFNDIVGERTYERGYQDAAIYLNGETTDSVGGGICQVASTIYCCALQANLEIVQRTEHMYFVTYVPDGQDATVYWSGGLDFQFRNTTDYPLRIDASVSGGYVHIALWGTNISGEYTVITSETLSVTPWQSVTVVDETKPPEYSAVTTTPYTGYVIRTYRNVYDRDGVLLSSTVEAESTYQKRDQVTTIGLQPEEPTEPETPETPPGSEGPITDPLIPIEPETPEEPVQPEEPPVEGDPSDPGTENPEEPVIPWYPDDPGTGDDTDPGDGETPPIFGDP